MLTLSMSASESVNDGEYPLSGLVVVDLASGIPGAYCTKLLADAGAVIIKLEAPEGDFLRRFSASSTKIEDVQDSAVFQFLACSKESVVIDPEDPIALLNGHRIIAGADAVVWSGESSLATHAQFSPAALRDRLPGLIVAAISPFGLEGPWAGRAATEFTLQAWAGAIGHRGVPGFPPVSVGGRVGEWAAGVYTAFGLLAAIRRRKHSGKGELLDTSVLDAVALTLTNMHPVTFFTEAGYPRDPAPSTLIPGIHPTADGWVGFMTGTGQQWLDFCVLVERFDWMEDLSLIRAQARSARRSEITECINEWTGARTTAEVVELASELRVPVSPVATGETAPLINPEMYTTNPKKRFTQPITPYFLSGDAVLPRLLPSPTLGEHTTKRTEAVDSPPQCQVPGGRPQGYPFEDLRIVDLTAFWAGPSATQAYAMLGADVIKVESPSRPDGLRAVSTRSLNEEQWWEHAPLFHATNTNKRSLGLRLDRPRGLEILRELLDNSDILIENYSPRVLDSWDLDYGSLSRTNPRLIVVRMPAFGLSGIWRNRTGFAQTMEQMSGMAWITGFPETVPIVPNGPCDPIAGAHAAFALEVALEHRERTGMGMLVEVPMVLSALNIAAEQVVEFGAYGVCLERLGNRGRGGTVQNLFRTSDAENGIGGPLVAISVETDEQWAAMVRVLGSPDWARRTELTTVMGRAAVASEIEENVASWCATRSLNEIVGLLWPAGVPVAKVLMPHEPDFTQFEARGFFERVDNPLVNHSLVPGLPVRFSAGPRRMNRRRAPQLGEHNTEVLKGLLGYSDGEIATLEFEGIVGKGLQVDSNMKGLD
jgi:crotonobetainyl-CoA:carnitine CoA-transferase CaiB-like acyl-CoA transferase